MSEKTEAGNKLIEKMRSNTAKQGRRTGFLPYRRTRMKVLKIRPKDTPETADTIAR